MTEKELYHFGVKGMKWGIRKDSKKLSEKQIKKRVKKLNDMQMFRDERDISSDANKKLSKPAKYARNTFVGLVAAGSVAINTSAAIMTNGLSLPFAAAQYAILGGGLAYNNRYYKNVPKKTDAIIKELDDNGVKVNTRDTNFSYYYNGAYVGSKKTKRYYINGYDGISDS